MMEENNESEYENSDEEMVYDNAHEEIAAIINDSLNTIAEELDGKIELIKVLKALADVYNFQPGDLTLRELYKDIGETLDKEVRWKIKSAIADLTCLISGTHQVIGRYAKETDTIPLSCTLDIQSEIGYELVSRYTGILSLSDEGKLSIIGNDSTLHNE